MCPDPVTELPLRALSHGLSEMQFTMISAALPYAGGRIDRLLVFTLLARRTLDSGRPTPVLSIANSLGLPFETTRRHVAALAEAGWCRRDRGGVLFTGSLDDAPMDVLAPLAHDCMVRFIADLGATGALPSFRRSTRPYSWRAGWFTAVDMMLAVVDCNIGTHQDRVNLVLFSTIQCANYRQVATNPVLTRRYAAMGTTLPEALKVPLRPRRLGELLMMPKATVRRRLDIMLQEQVQQLPDGLVINEAFLRSPRSMETKVAMWANLRRLMAGLAMLGFPFDDPESAYVVGRPATTPID
ncbi:hypothetical protein [Sphingomonas corticis]|jgi:hypothetical protein|uniref:Uncharacterized protein n=1 Tax=Sphingomonas corticis TaxID=2722791 RepID=A0ABX1CS09_9SPHN|nr:hypothetical protein [Sphingomonas corticis]NJR78800.1 hypothetical protein [Sphingomonas corticis]